MIDDTNLLFDAMKASMKGSAWKLEPQKFYHNWLINLYDLKNELKEHTYQTSPCSEFTLNERGKIRHIHGNRMRDRVVRHALCDEVLTPCLDKYLIHNNGASRKGKGIRFAREMFERDLHNYWLENRTNDGYIGFVDFSKYYDNIQHDKIKENIYPRIKYRLTDTGKVVKRINPKSVTRERRRLKAYKRILDKGIIQYEDIEQAYKSWMGDFSRLMSKTQTKNMKRLYKELFGKEPQWKQ